MTELNSSAFTFLPSRFYNLVMKNSKIIEWLLRVGVAGEFLGHGMLALGGKADWIGWISDLLKVNPETAATILLVIGISDIVVALVVLVRPVKPVLLWAALWGFWTALLRPIVGQPIWDFIERFANWAAPLALFYIYKNKNSGQE
jgi:hypothetical protein